ncbi:acyltransferase [Pseudoroseicyclus sp. H15]
MLGLPRGLADKRAAKALADYQAWLPASVTLPDPSQIEVVPLAEPPSRKNLEVAGIFGPDSFLFLWGWDAPTIDAYLRIIALKGRPSDNVRLGVGPVRSGTIAIGIKGRGARFALGESRKARVKCHLIQESEIAIGDGTTVENAEIDVRKGQAMIGRDCMLSGHIDIKASAHHGIIDLSGPEPVIDDRKPSVTVGDHVWIGQGAMMVGRASIGSGSILGAGALLASNAPANVALAGNPAQVVRERVTWCREPHAIDPAAQDYISSLDKAPVAHLPADLKETTQ